MHASTRAPGCDIEVGGQPGSLSSAPELPGQPVFLVARTLLRDGCLARQGKAVTRARVDVQLGRHTRVVQPHGVVDVLVTKAVDSTNGHERRRETGQIR